MNPSGESTLLGFIAWAVQYCRVDAMNPGGGVYTPLGFISWAVH